MYTIHVNESSSYEIQLGNNLLNEYLEKISDQYSQLFFLVDDNLNHIKADYYLHASEENKSLCEVGKIVECMLSKNINKKNSVLVCIGGGITLDTGGFVASTYKRGIDTIYIPTTLLAMVDVAIGSKNGVNYNSIKNMVGSFYSPKHVLIDVEFLNSLPKRQFNSGIAEIIKYGCIYDPSLLYKLMTDFDTIDLIYCSLQIKKYYVEADPKEKGIRSHLNFGHTIGHAIEAYFKNNEYLHGEAISIGMNYKFKNELLKSVCEKYELPTELPVDIKMLEKYMINDKKNSLNNINFITLNKLGDVK